MHVINCYSILQFLGVVVKVLNCYNLGMQKLLGSNDFYEDRVSDFCVTLMSDYQNNLIAFANKPSKLTELQCEDKPVFLDFGGGEGFWFEEFPENLLAKDGYEISFESATRYFPYLKDKVFWIEERWAGYKGIKFDQLLATYDVY